MGKGYILRARKTMSEEDQRAFDRWLKANAVVGLIFAAGIIAMAWAGSIRCWRIRRKPPMSESPHRHNAVTKAADCAPVATSTTDSGAQRCHLDRCDHACFSLL
jgi:hypothetical protein